MHLTGLLRRARASGFSLVELMIVLAIVAILLLIAVPSFQVWIANSRMRSTAEALQNDIRLAEQYAVSNNHQTAFVLTTAPASTASVAALSTTPVAAGAAASYWFVQQTPSTYDVSQAPIMVAVSPTGQTSGVLITAIQAPDGVSNGNGVAALCYNSVGRQVTVTTAQAPIPANCSAADTQFSITMPSNAALSGYRPLRVTADLGGRVRVCDPSVSITVEPYGC